MYQLLRKCKQGMWTFPLSKLLIWEICQAHSLVFFFFFPERRFGKCFLPVHVCLVQIVETYGGASELVLHRHKIIAVQGLVQQSNSRQHFHGNQELLVGQVILSANTGQSELPESHTAHMCFGDGIHMTMSMPTCSSLAFRRAR